MAITFKFKQDETVKEALHNALVGSPAYVDSEIALVDDEGFTKLVVGNNNEDNVSIEVKEPVLIYDEK